MGDRQVLQGVHQSVVRNPIQVPVVNPVACRRMQEITLYRGNPYIVARIRRHLLSADMAREQHTFDNNSYMTTTYCPTTSRTTLKDQFKDASTGRGRYSSNSSELRGQWHGLVEDVNSVMQARSYVILLIVVVVALGRLTAALIIDR